MAIYSGARILCADIEAAKGEALVPFYQLKQHSKYINPDYVIKPVTIVCVAWRWVGESATSSVSVLKNGEEGVVKVLCDLINEADIIVAHNGDRFDWPIIKTRALYYGLPPVKEPKTVDTLKAVRKFKFESNALRYVNKYLNIAQKDKAPDWDLVSQGDVEEIKKCEAYCRGDIRALHDLYLRIRPWMRNHPHVGIYNKGLEHAVCRVCGSDDLEEEGHIETTATRAYQLYRCVCGALNRGSKNIAGKLLTR